MNIMQRLAQCADELDSSGLHTEADVVTEVMKKISGRTYEFEEEETQADADVMIEIESETE